MKRIAQFLKYTGLIVMSAIVRTAVLSANAELVKINSAEPMRPITVILVFIASTPVAELLWGPGLYLKGL